MSAWRRNLVLLGAGISIVHAIAFGFLMTAVQSHGGDMRQMISDKDQGEYMSLANVMLGEHRFALTPDAAPEVFRTPGYPAFILVIGLLVGGWFWALFLVHCALAGAVSVVVALLVRELGLRMRWAMGAGVIAGLSSGLFLLTTTGTGGDTLYTLTYATAALVAVRCAERRSWIFPAALGLLLAFATYIRPIGMLASVPLLFGAAFIASPGMRVYLRETSLAVLMFALMLSPWYARNALVAGAPIFSTVSTYNLTYYNIPFSEAFWTHQTESETRATHLRTVGTTSEEVLRGTTYLGAMRNADAAYLSGHLAEYAAFHMARIAPFFFASGFNVIHAIASAEAPSLYSPFFPSEGENLTRSISEHRWGDALAALSHYWFTSLERLSWLLAIGAALIAPLLSAGRQRRILLLFVAIIITNIILVSPVTQARYRVPAEPFIWSSAMFFMAAVCERLRKSQIGLGALRGHAEFGAYATASLTALLIDTSILAFLTSITGVHYLLAGAISFCAGLAFIYVASTRWVFSSRRLDDPLVEFGIFAAIGLIGLVINELLLWILTDVAGFYYLASKAASVIIVFAWNYLARKRMLFVHHA